MPACSDRHRPIGESRRPTDDEYRQLLEFRVRLRRFEHWSEQQARRQGLTPAQHQLLLAIRGHEGDLGPSISDVATYLLLRHHSAVGLVDRAEANGLVRREPDSEHRSIVRLALTEDGRRHLDALSETHLEEVPRLMAAMRTMSDDPPGQPAGG